MHEQNEIINKEMEIIRIQQTLWYCIIPKWKNSVFRELINRLGQTEERLGKLEDRSLEIIKSKEQKEKRMTSEESPRDL